MDRLWQQLAIATNWPVLVAVAALSSLGVISIYARSPADGPKQLVYLAVATGCMMLFQAVNYQKIGRYAWGLYLFSLALIGYTVLGAIIWERRHGNATQLAPDQATPLPFVHAIKGACAWLNFGPISLEPSELMKIAFVLVLARYLRFRSNYRTLRGLLAPFALALIPVAFIMKQPDLGVAAIFIPTLFAMLYVAGAKIRHLLIIIALGVVLVPVAWLAGTDTSDKDHPVPHSNIPGFRYLPELVRKYQRKRVYDMFSHNSEVLQQGGFQQYHARIAFGSGGLTGKGFGVIPMGRQIPEAHNDMILALIGEQFGFVGTLLLLGSYLVLFTAGIEIAAATKEPFGRLIAVGVVSLLAGQSMLNLAVAMGMMPVTGITLPFVSYGGSSLVASFMAAGLLLNVGQNRPLTIAPQSFEYD